MSKTLQIALFGGVRATDGDGNDLDVGPAKCQLVLAALALAAGAPLSVSRLVEMVWDTDPPRTADKTLQSYIARLRKGMGADIISRAGAAYVLNVSPDVVDVLRFQQLLDDGDPAQALASWSSEPLAGLDAGGFRATIDGLTERWLGAVELDLERRVDEEPAGTVGQLTELTALHPYREGLWALLLLALYRSGRQADALAAYRSARSNLIEELGVEPGPRLQGLEAMILGQDDQLDLGRERAEVEGLPTGTVTFGFAEVTDAAALWANSRSMMTASMGRCEDVVRGAAANRGGHLFTMGGDSFGVAFGRTSEAADWAADLHELIRAVDWSGAMPLTLGIALHTGEADERDGDYFGPAINLAARIAGLAHGGQTVLSASTAALLGPRADIADIGVLPASGDAAAARVHQLGAGNFAPLRSVDAQSGNLPRRLGRLIGRHDELGAIARALDSVPVVTLVGPGGIGKTRLAIEAGTAAAVDLVDEVWLVELASTTASDGVARAVASALEVKEAPGLALSDSIVAALGDRSVLLILDNCEHVVDGAANLANAIAQRCPHARVLATSREGLGLTTEQLIVIPPLDPGQSGVELFNMRARAADADFDPVENHHAVEEICRRLDGVPLAIELAAARSHTLSPSDLVSRLDDRLRLLTGGRRSSVERHRTMRATIQWSYELLRPEEQELFQQLSVFAGPFDLAAAEVIAARANDAAAVVPADVDDLLGGLVAQSILIAESGPFGRRFRLLETIRQFGAERLSSSGATDRVAALHAQWCLDRAVAIGDLLAGNDEVLGSRYLAELWPNLRVAFAWAISTGNAILGRDLLRPVVLEVSLRNNSEVGDWAERLLRITPPGEVDVIAFGLFWSAHRYMMSQNQNAYDKLAAEFGEPDHPLMPYARACVEDDDHELIATAPAAAAFLQAHGHDVAARLVEIEGAVGPLLALGDFAGFADVCDDLLDRCRRDGPPTFLHFTLFIAGMAATIQGQTDDAELYFDEATQVRVPERTISLSKLLESRRAFRDGDVSRALRLLVEHVDELLASENMIMARLVGAEFARTIVDLERPAAVARIIGYVERSGPCGELAWGTLTLETRDAVRAAAGINSDAEHAIGSELDDRDALLFMRGVLVELLSERSSPSG